MACWRGDAPADVMYTCAPSLPNRRRRWPCTFPASDLCLSCLTHASRISPAFLHATSCCFCCKQRRQRACSYSLLPQTPGAALAMGGCISLSSSRSVHGTAGVSWQAVLYNLLYITLCHSCGTNLCLRAPPASRDADGETGTGGRGRRASVPGVTTSAAPLRAAAAPDILHSTPRLRLFVPLSGICLPQRTATSLPPGASISYSPACYARTMLPLRNCLYGERGVGAFSSTSTRRRARLGDVRRGSRVKRSARHSACARLGTCLFFCSLSLPLLCIPHLHHLYMLICYHHNRRCTCLLWWMRIKGA